MVYRDLGLVQAARTSLLEIRLEARRAARANLVDATVAGLSGEAAVKLVLSRAEARLAALVEMIGASGKKGGGGSGPDVCSKRTAP